jgi:two-component system, NarL family, invasion response regulator UvrY
MTEIPSSVLVVDDEVQIRRFLRTGFELDGFTVQEAETGAEALRAATLKPSDLVILDLNLPGISGLEVLNRLLIENNKARILVISMYDNPVYVARVIEAGAQGYVSKNAPPDQILEAVRRVVSGRSYIEPEMAQELALGHVGATSHRLNQLSARDVEVLRLLADGSSLTEIAEAIGVSYKTVANQCSQLKAKLATPRTADLIRLAIAYGLGRGEPRLAAPVDADDAARR